MRILIDTHIFIWCDQRPNAIEKYLFSVLRDGGNQIFVSAASVWEISIKRALGKLVFPASIAATAALLGFEMLPITAVQAEFAGGLPPHHSDPFDRLIVAQASLEQLVLGTQDRIMGRYGVVTLGLN